MYVGGFLMRESSPYVFTISLRASGTPDAHQETPRRTSGNCPFYIMRCAENNIKRTTMSCGMEEAEQLLDLMTRTRDCVAPTAMSCRFDSSFTVISEDQWSAYLPSLCGWLGLTPNDEKLESLLVQVKQSERWHMCRYEKSETSYTILFVFFDQETKKYHVRVFKQQEK